jgi:hypothetical protein
MDILYTIKHKYRRRCKKKKTNKQKAVYCMIYNYDLLVTLSKQN